MLTRPIFCTLFFIGVVTAQSVRYRDEAFANAISTRDLAYGSAVNRWTSQTETLLLDVYEPAGDTAALRPAVVVVHGGGFTSGSRTTVGAVQMARTFARRGYVAASISYRLAPDPTTVQQHGPQVVVDASHDFKAAVRWLRSQAIALRIAPDRIASIGMSAGAFTIMAGAYLEGAGASGNPGFSSEVGCVMALWGGFPALQQMEAGEAPIFLAHGTQDVVVSPMQSIDVHQRALQVGIPSELHLMQGIGHSASFGAFLTLHLDDAFAFAWEHLKLGGFAGLELLGQATAPGTANLRTTGEASDIRWLGMALAPQALPIPGFGMLCLDAASLAIAPMPSFAATPRLPSQNFQLTVPTSAVGLDIYLQELHFDALGQSPVLTNCLHLDL